jgi:hypothetical protein
VQNQWLDEERHRRQATSWVGPVVGIYLLMLGGTLLFVTVREPGLPLGFVALAAALVVVGFYLVLRWWLATRAVYMVPDGDTRRRMSPTERVLLERDVLLRRAQSRRLPLAGSLLLLGAAGGVAEALAGDEELWLTVILLVGGGVWLLARWWNARRLLRSVDAEADALSWATPVGQVPPTAKR